MPVNPANFAKAKLYEKNMFSEGAEVAQVIGQVTMLVKSLTDYELKIKDALVKAPGNVPGLSANAKKDMKALVGNFAKWPFVSKGSSASINLVKTAANTLTKEAITAKDVAAGKWAANALLEANKQNAGLTQGTGAINTNMPKYLNFKKNKYLFP